MCDFEGNLCGFQQGSENNFDWWIEKPREAQYIQRPRIDSNNSTKGKRQVKRILIAFLHLLILY